MRRSTVYCPWFGTLLVLVAGCGEALPIEDPIGGSGGGAPAPVCRHSLDCDDGNPCTEDVCDSTTETCSNLEMVVGTDCAVEGNPGRCAQGQCVGLCSDIACDDSNPCTEDVCNPADGSCSPASLPDETDCPFGEMRGQCASGVCVGLCVGVDCSDENECTEDLCEPADGRCTNTLLPDGALCDLVDFRGVCSSGLCVDAELCREANCGDNDPCTDDVCDPLTGDCSNPPRTEGSACVVDGDPGRCSESRCVGLCEGTDCQDENPCTGDACNPSNGSCPRLPVANGTACRLGDGPGKCSGGVCVGLCVGVQCNDQNECTSDACDASTGSCTHASRPDGSSCPEGTCQDGGCAAPRCGNSITDPGEECDDGNAVWGDGCFNCSTVFYFILNSPSTFSRGNDSITRVDKRGHNEVILGPNIEFNGTRELEIEPDGTVLYVLQSTFPLMQHRILYVDPSDGFLLDEVRLDTTNLGYSATLGTMTRGINGLLYLLVRDTSQLGRRVRPRMITVDPRTKSVAEVMELPFDDGPTLDMTRNEIGDFFVSTGNEVKLIDPAYRDVVTWADGLAGAFGLTFDAITASLWVAVMGNRVTPATVLRLDQPREAIVLGELPAQQVRGLLIDTDGLPLITLGDKNQVAKMRADGTLVDVWSENIDHPNDIKMLDLAADVAPTLP